LWAFSIPQIGQASFQKLKDHSPADPHSRDAALPPHWLEGGPDSRDAALTPLRLSPTPPQGGSDYCCSQQRLPLPPAGRPAPQSPPNVFQTLKNHSPLEGESERSSRMAKADPVGSQRRGPSRGRRQPEPNGEGFCGGGAHKASQGRELVRRHGYAQPKLLAKADAAGGHARSGSDSQLSRQRLRGPAYSP
jgi:hypothetical protein